MMSEPFEHAHDGLSRRSFLAGMGVLGLAVASGIGLSACASGSTSSSSTSAASESASSSASSSSSAASSSSSASASSSSKAAAVGTVSGNVLVAYYSGTGNTRRVAKRLAKDLDADLFEIEPANAYSEADLDFNDEDSRVVQEYEDESKRDDSLKKNAPDNFADYDTVLIGYPIWWSDAAWAMQGFASKNDFTGKTVIPFCTSYSSPIGDSGDTLKDLADGKGDWREGERFEERASNSDIDDWADSLKG